MRSAKIRVRSSKIVRRLKGEPGMYDLTLGGWEVLNSSGSADVLNSLSAIKGSQAESWSATTSINRHYCGLSKISNGSCRYHNDFGSTWKDCDSVIKDVMRS